MINSSINLKKIYAYIRGKFNNSSVYIPEINDDIACDWHISFIKHLASLSRPTTYVELGLYKCELFNQLIPYSKRLIGIDKNPDAQKYINRSPKVEFWNMTTLEFSEKLKQNPFVIDMAFIDADHSRQSVWEDFWNIFPYLSPHGLLLLHDAHPGDEKLIDQGYCGDGYLSIDILSRQREEFELMTLPFSPGLAICRKRKSQLSWQE